MENNIIGTRITDARKKLNLSQAQLAERLFISPQAVGKWERGESFPDIVTVNRLAEILGVDLNYFSGNFPSTATAPRPKSRQRSARRTPRPTSKATSSAGTCRAATGWTPTSAD
ncbi:MAG: helix-turn-helix transcriptional regulator [Flavobacteriales bacterium]|nr:helix-turn-helix transcriptional regulator [Flavobacteriales bacterium]